MPALSCRFPSGPGLLKGHLISGLSLCGEWRDVTETACLLIPDLPEGVSGAATRGVLEARVRVHCDGVHPGGRSHSPDGVLMGRMPDLRGYRARFR